MNYRTLSLAIMLVSAQLSFATSADYYYLPDQEAIRTSRDIVEGTVVHAVPVPASYFHPPCYTYLYQLRVSRSFKGTFKVGDIVDVGMGRLGQSAEAGQSHLLVLNAPSKFSHQYCRHKQIGGLFKEGEIYTQFSSKVGLFNIFLAADGKKMFKAETCEENDFFMYSGFFKELGFVEQTEMRGNRNCTFIVAPYQELLNKILEDVVSTREEKAPPAAT